MTAKVILDELRLVGVTVTVLEDGNLFLAPRSALSPPMIEVVKAHKAEIIYTLRISEAEPKRPDSETVWPDESVAAERRFRQPHAKLFPFIGKRVWTPYGTGKILAVHAGRCEVLLDGAGKTIRIHTDDVRPIQ